MKQFKEFYEDKENSEILEESVLLGVLGGVLGIPVLLGVSWGASWVTKKYTKLSRNIILGIIHNFRGIRENFRRDKKGATDKIKKTIKEIESVPEVKKAVNDIDKLQVKYYEELKDIYAAIEKKDIDTAEDLHSELPINIQENPEVKVAIINVILQEFEEPPVYIVSPGNDTYQAIKRLFGQKVARAMEELGKRGFSKYYERVNGKEETQKEEK